MTARTVDPRPPLLLLVCLPVLLLPGPTQASQRATGPTDHPAMLSEVDWRAAHAAEDELVDLIGKASAPFVFVGGGSGVCLSPDGWILTNYHVVEKKSSWIVRLQGSGRLHRATVVGLDPIGDLCLLKIEERGPFPWAPLASFEELRVGQQLLALGDPYKLSDADGTPSVSLGALSALRHFQLPRQTPLAREDYVSCSLQTDAAVNPGNSGGPLLDLQGRLVGITTQIMARFHPRANSGVAYAIACDQLARFIPLLKQANGGVARHGTLPDGIEFEDWKGEAVSDRKEHKRAPSLRIKADSPAFRAGLRSGDRLLAVEGEPVGNPLQALGLVQSWPAATTLRLRLFRGGKERTLELVLDTLAVSLERRAQVPFSQHEGSDRGK